METSTNAATPHVSGSTVESALGRSNTHSAKPLLNTRVSRVAEHTSAKDPHGISDSAPLAFAAYRVAIECHSTLLNRTIDEAAVLDRLRRLAPTSAFQLDYVARQAFKLINPRGHGANSSRFRNETLGWFRQMYPDDSHLTSGFIMLLCAAKWWTHEQGQRSIIPRMNPLTTSDLDRKLKSFGFLSGERQAICRLLRRDQGAP